MRVTTTLILALTALAGCQTLGGSAPLASIDNETATTQIGHIDRLEPLTDAQLPERQCGMILWTLDAQRPSPIFRFVSEQDAQIAVGGKTINLQRVGFDGQSGFGVFENQTFTSVEGVNVDVEAQFGLSFDGGVYLERGIVKVTGADGWSVVSPAAGIAGCRS